MTADVASFPRARGSREQPDRPPSLVLQKQRAWPPCLAPGLRAAASAVSTRLAPGTSCRPRLLHARSPQARFVHRRPGAPGALAAHARPRTVTPGEAAEPASPAPAAAVSMAQTLEEAGTFFPPGANGVLGEARTAWTRKLSPEKVTWSRSHTVWKRWGRGRSQVGALGPGAAAGRGQGGPSALRSSTLTLLSPSPAKTPQQNALSIPGSPRSQLTDRQKEIYKFLEAQGPQRALHIAKALGMETAKDVNPDLYTLKKLHLLDLDQNSSMWAVYRPGSLHLPAHSACPPHQALSEAGQSGGTNQATTIIVQKNPVNMISQNAPQSGIYIQNCADLQIGHGNIIMKPEASAGSGAMAPPHLPPPQNPTPGMWGSQNIHLEKSVLKLVQLGHANQMSVHSAEPEDSAHSPLGSPLGSPPVSATTATPEASFKWHMSHPGPAPEGAVEQEVHLSSCALKNVSIGISNRTTSARGGPAGPHAAGPGGSNRGAGELEEDPGPPSGASPPRGTSRGQADVRTPTAHLGALTLESKALRAAEGGHGEDSVQMPGPVGASPWHRALPPTDSLCDPPAPDTGPA
ncbi:PREDICTED: Z-DNA-binding protein 1 [Condylura cristata]|uniref:Z-DNA-binding protein 1 n=1 Tax=Condylura cristata TaxID=143302 RepID=UPI00064377BB|nr:PREDICTED: Z-DNA-binding protein 1 [Condylura cristata]